MRTIFKIVQKTFPCLEMAKKRICFHFKVEETMKEAGTKFSNACGIRKSSSDLGAKISVCPEVETAPERAYEELCGRGTPYSQEETQITPKGTFLYTKE